MTNKPISGEARYVLWCLGSLVTALVIAVIGYTTTDDHTARKLYEWAGSIFTVLGVYFLGRSDQCKALNKSTSSNPQRP